MKKFLLPLTLFLLTGLVFYACRKADSKENLVTQQKDQDISLEEAKAIFGLVESKINPQTLSGSAPTKLFNVPNWSSAVYEKGANDIGYWKVRLNCKEKIVRQFSFFLNGIKQDQVILPNPNLLIYRDSAQNLQVLVMQEIPHPSSNKTEAETGFTGDINMYDWSGEFVCGVVFQNGKKKKQIISTTSKYNRKASANARWENVCKEWTDCEYQATCAGSGSTGYETIVAFAETRNESGCSAPTEDPYASTWSANPGLSWTCEGWQNTATRKSMVCEDVWIDDIPDPDPDGDGSGDTYPPVLAPGDRLCKYSFYYKNVSETDAFYATYMNGMRIENSKYFHNFPPTLFFLSNGITDYNFNRIPNGDYFGRDRTPYKYIQDFLPGLFGTDIYSKVGPNGKVWYFTPKAAEEISALVANLAGQFTASQVPDAANPANPLTEPTWYGIADAMIKTFMPGSRISIETPTRVNGATNSNAVYDKTCN